MTLSSWSLVFVLLGACLLGAVHAQLPPTFLGAWAGVPTVSTLGPWDQALQFNIDPFSGGGWLMSDTMNSSSDTIPYSVQRFYVNESTYVLTYCGALRNFFSTNQSENATVAVWLLPQLASWTDKSLSWCLSNGGCSALQWTLTLVDADTLLVSVVLSDPVQHLLVTLTRTATEHTAAAAYGASAGAMPSPEPHACVYGPLSFDAAARLPAGHPAVPGASLKAMCPYQRRQPVSPAPAVVSDPPASFCYVLNSALGYRLSWVNNAAAGTVSITISAPLPPNSWISLGFQDQRNFPFMQGADIVLGYAGSPGCVRTMFANAAVGTPVDDSTLTITNSSVEYSGGVLTLSFTRPLNSGHNPLPVVDPALPQARPLLMWATGATAANATCATVPGYHRAARGLHSVWFPDGTLTFPDVMACPV